MCVVIPLDKLLKLELLSYRYIRHAYVYVCVDGIYLGSILLSSIYEFVSSHNAIHCMNLFS